jgi:hypothetical protein
MPPERISLRDIMQEQERKVKPIKQALPAKITPVSLQYKVSYLMIVAY